MELSDQQLMLRFMKTLGEANLKMKPLKERTERASPEKQEKIMPISMEITERLMGLAELDGYWEDKINQWEKEGIDEEQVLEEMNKELHKIVNEYIKKVNEILGDELTFEERNLLTRFFSNADSEVLKLFEKLGYKDTGEVIEKIVN